MDGVVGDPVPDATLGASASHCDLEFAHVLFTDLVGYSLLSMERQREYLAELQAIVHASSRFREAEAAHEIVTLPTGDGMALVFFRDPAAPAQCASEIARALAHRPHLRLRMGIHSGPVYRVTDVNAHANVAGGGINLAQRVMDCGDAGHILVSQSAAEVLLQMGQWSPCLKDLGEVTVKHGAKVHIYNLAAADWGNPARPVKLSRQRQQPLRRHAIAAALALTAAGVLWWTQSRPAATTGSDAPSIAVLPFQDMSPEKNQAYFSDGLAEELLDGLAKIPGLSVVGRASAFQFRDRVEDIQTVAAKLHVSTILEGSVRRQGDRARVSVQLINGASGLRMWSEVFDRDLRDILAVEQEIARAVTGALRVKLLGGQSTPQNVNPEAHNAYLQGRYFFGRSTREDMERAADYFESATRLQPEYAAAWLGLGAARLSQADAGYGDSRYRPIGREALEKARTLDPSLAEAHAALGWLKISESWDWSGAEVLIRRALELEPNNAEVLRYAVRLARGLGRGDEAVTLSRRAASIDPLNQRIFHSLGVALYDRGLLAEAAKAFQKALELNPQMLNAHLSLAKVHLAAGGPPQALEEALKEKHAAYGLLARALAYHAVGRKAESDAALSELVAKFAVEDAFQIAEAYAFRGQSDLAFEWLERARVQRDPGFSMMKDDPLLKSLEQDLRYAPFLKKIGL